MGIFRKLSNVIDKMFHEDLFDEPVKKRSCKRGKCCCKHHSKREKISKSHVIHNVVEKKEYSKPTFHKSFIPPIPKPSIHIPCQSCHSRHSHHEEPHQHQHHHHEEHHHEHNHHEHDHHEHDHHEHDHNKHDHHEHDHHEHSHHEHEHHEHEHHEHHQYNHHEHEHHEYDHHEHVHHENHQKENTFDDEEYRRFYYQTLPQINIQKSVHSLEYEVDDAIRFAEND